MILNRNGKRQRFSFESIGILKLKYATEVPQNKFIVQLSSTHLRTQPNLLTRLNHLISLYRHGFKLVAILRACNQIPISLPGLWPFIGHETLLSGMPVSRLFVFSEF